MYRYLIDNILPNGIPVFPFGDASYLARNTNLGSLGASGRIAMIILSCLIPNVSHPHENNPDYLSNQLILGTFNRGY